MKAADLRQLRPDELESRIAELRDTLFNMRIKRATGQLENMAGVRSARRDLARALTVQAAQRKSG